MAKHTAKFDWPLLSDVAAVTKPICKTHTNFLGCPKLPNLPSDLSCFWAKVHHIMRTCGGDIAV